MKTVGTLEEKIKMRVYEHDAELFNNPNTGAARLNLLDMASNEVNNKTALSIGFGKSADISINFIHTIYRDLIDFKQHVNHYMSEKAPFYTDRQEKMITFLPACSALHKTHIQYLQALISMDYLFVHDGCLSKKHPIPMSIADEKRHQIVKEYRYLLVWEPHFEVEGYVSENFFRYLSYNTLLVVLGPKDLSTFLPEKNSIVDVRNVSGSPKRLVDQLGRMNTNDWKRMIAWKTGPKVSNEKFKALWGNSAENLVCRICESLSGVEAEISSSVVPASVEEDGEE